MDRLRLTGTSGCNPLRTGLHRGNPGSALETLTVSASYRWKAAVPLVVKMTVALVLV